MKTLVGALFAALAALSWCPSAEAQSQELLRTQGAPIHFTYHWATGQITRGSGPPASSADVPQPSYANDTFSGLYLLAQIGNELIDWGVKSGGLGGMMTSFDLSYGASVLDTSVGGPGAKFNVVLYSGMIGNCAPGDPGVVIGEFPFTGLPSSPDGNAYVYNMTVDLSGAPLQFPDGPIGISYHNSGGGVGPMMVPIGCCNTGTKDRVDKYKYPATQNPCKGSQGYTPAGNTSYHLVIYEDPAAGTATATINNGSGVNALDFQSLSLPVLGTSWLSSVALLPSTAVTVVAYSAIPAAPSPFPFGAGELLVPIAPLPFLQFTQDGNHSLGIPASPTWSGVPLYTQALRVNLVPGLLSMDALNGIDLVIGT